jgi:hypothetical protein
MSEERRAERARDERDANVAKDARIAEFGSSLGKKSFGNTSTAAFA